MQTLYDLWVSLFGAYEPIMTDVLDDTGAVVGEVVASGCAGVNWQYLVMLLAFVVLLHGTLRIIEAVFRNV